MTTRLRVFLLFGSGLLVLIIGAIAASQSQAVRRQALHWAEAGLTDLLGRAVRVEDVILRPWAGRLDLSRVRVAQGPTLAQGDLFSANVIQARWSWTALLRREIVLRQVTMVGPRLTLSAEGATPVAPQDILATIFRSRDLQAGGWPLRIRKAVVQDGRVTWADPDGTHGGLEGLEGVLTWGATGDGGESATGEFRAARLRLVHGEKAREAERLSLRMSGTAESLEVAEAQFSVAGARVTTQGRIAPSGEGARLDLTVGVQAPAEALLAALGYQRKLAGTLQVDGRLQGPWERVAFRGDGTLQIGTGRETGGPLRFSLRWESGRLEAEGTGSPSASGGTLRWSMTLEPGSGAYRLLAGVQDADLAVLAGLPAAALALAGAEPPREIRGRLTGEMDLTGQGKDLTTLRGHARVRVEGLGLASEMPTGRLEARVNATPSRLEVETFTLKLPGGDVQGRGNLRFGSGQLDLPIRADIPDVASFGRGFGLPFLAGRAALQGRLVGQRDAPQFQGRLTWRDAKLAGRTLDLVEGDVQVGSRSLRTSRLLLRLGRTSATLRGSVVASGTAPLRQLNPKRDLAFDLQGQMHPAHTADLVDLLPEGLEIQGAFRATGRLAGTLQAPTGEVELTLENVRTWEESWRRGEALLRLRPGGLDIQRLSLRRGEEQLTGEIGVGEDGTLRGRLTSTGMDLGRVGSLSGSDVTGRASFRLELQGTLRETRTAGQATASALAYRGIPLGPGTASFTILPGAVELDLAIREGSYRLQATIGRSPDRSLKADLSLREADLDLLARLREIRATAPWQARGSGRILLRGPKDDLSASQGEADLAILRLKMGEELWENRGPVRVAWSGPTTTLRQVRLRSAGREFDLRGTLSEGDQTDLLVTGQLPLVALAPSVPMMGPTEGLAIANLRLRGPQKSPELRGTLEIQRGGVVLPGLPAEFREVEADLELQGSRIEIRRWQARLAGGNFRSTGEIRRRGEAWALQLTFQEDGGRAEQLLLGLYGGKGEVTGALSLGGILTSEWEDESGFWRNLDGDLKLTMRDGRIGRYTVMAKILTLLNVAQLLELKVPDLLAEGMPYKTLTADIKIERGIARTENLVLDSQPMKVNAVGQVNLVEDTVDLTVAVKPLQTVDRILARIPVAGWLLGGKEKSLLVAYYQVSGSLRDPQVSPIPLKSVGRNVFGIFRRLLEIPEALIGPLEGSSPPPATPGLEPGR